MTFKLSKTLPFLLAGSLTACRDSSGPELNPDLVDLVLDFCSFETPSFVAVQNEGAGWTPVSGDANGTFTISANPKFGLALVHPKGFGSFSTEVLYVTRSDLAPLDGVQCVEQLGLRTLTGTVSGLSDSQIADISMQGQSRSVFYFEEGDFLFSLFSSQPVDLVAQRSNFFVVDKLIVRRGIALASGSAMPVLDFNATEALAPAVNLITVTGQGIEPFWGAEGTFYTAGSTEHRLTFTPLGSATSGTLYGVPASLTLPGDLHEISAYAYSADGRSQRTVTRLDRNPADRTLALGPVLVTPTVTTVASSPALRMRAQLASQSDYGAVAAALFMQVPASGLRDIVVIMTSGYNGSTPVTWDLQVPDFAGLAGFPAGAALVNSDALDWIIQASSSPLTAAIGGAPVDGTVAKHGTRSSGSGLFVAGAVSGARRHNRRMIARLR